jgi:hypothetical protein
MGEEPWWCVGSGDRFHSLAWLTLAQRKPLDCLLPSAKEKNVKYNRKMKSQEHTNGGNKYDI